MIKHATAIGLLAIAAAPVAAFTPYQYGNAQLEHYRDSSFTFQEYQVILGGIASLNGFPSFNGGATGEGTLTKLGASTFQEGKWVIPGDPAPGLTAAQGPDSVVDAAFGSGETGDRWSFGSDYTFTANIWSDRTVKVSQPLDSLDPALVSDKLAPFIDAMIAASIEADFVPSWDTPGFFFLGRSQSESSLYLQITEDGCLSGTCAVALARSLVSQMDFYVTAYGPNPYEWYFQTASASSIDGYNGVYDGSGWQFTYLPTVIGPADGIDVGQQGNDALNVAVRAGRDYTLFSNLYCSTTMTGAAAYFEGNSATCNNSAYWNGITDIRTAAGNPVSAFAMTAGSGFDYRPASPLSPSPATDTPVTDMVPEPASWAMLIAGFGLVGAAARRNRRGAAGHAIG